MPVAGEGAAWSVARTAEAFGLGLSLALPFIAVSFAYNLALGALSRAMPQLLVALVGAPLLIGLGLGKVELLVLGGIIFAAAAVYATVVGAPMFAVTVLAIVYAYRKIF